VSTAQHGMAWYVGNPTTYPLLVSSPRPPLSCCSVQVSASRQGHLAQKRSERLEADRVRRDGPLGRGGGSGVGDVGRGGHRHGGDPDQKPRKDGRDTVVVCS
jgi:hypothetical protein